MNERQAIRCIERHIEAHGIGNYPHIFIGEALQMAISALQAQKKLRTERDAAVEDLHHMHTLCMDIGGCCPECGSQIDDLMDAACQFCKKSGLACWVDDPDNERRCAAFEWRGPQKGVTVHDAEGLHQG